MKIDTSLCLNTLVILIGCLVMTSSLACNSKSEKSGATVFDEKPTTSTVTAQATDTTTKSSLNANTSLNEGAVTNTKGTTEEVKPIVKPTLKICSPSFNLVGKPKSNRYIYYVTGFNPGEFKCWAEIENHGQQICNGEPCVIYYIDSPKAKVNATPPHYIDPSILKEHGIGQFEHTNHWWEVKGAKQLWGRPGKEFVYYNTNNNAGG